MSCLSRDSEHRNAVRTAHHQRMTVPAHPGGNDYETIAFPNDSLRRATCALPLDRGCGSAPWWVRIVSMTGRSRHGGDDVGRLQAAGREWLLMAGGLNRSLQGLPQESSGLFGCWLFPLD